MDIKLFCEIDLHLMNDAKPSKYLKSLSNNDKLNEFPYTMLSDLEHIEQNKKFHPEGNVWEHTMLVINEAAKRRQQSLYAGVLMWAAMLHDIGKAAVTRNNNGKITSYNHELVGKDMSIKFLSAVGKDQKFINSVSSLVRWHMESLFASKDLPFLNIRHMLNEVPLDEIILLSLCDRLGRGDMSLKKIEEEKKGIAIFINKCKEVTDNN